MNNNKAELTKKPFVSQQFLIFLLTGGTAAIVNFSSRLFYNQWMSFSSAVMLAYLTGMITSFVLAKFFVFKESKQPLSRSLLFFTLVNIIAVLQTWTISISLANYFLPLIGFRVFAEETAHAIGIIVPVFTSFAGHKHFTFK
ncbi:MAG: GtrA family protein [Legionellaceae bacterium]|nr:GtrA family protein [Legionellaceae bacterium]